MEIETEEGSHRDGKVRMYDLNIDPLNSALVDHRRKLPGNQASGLKWRRLPSRPTAGHELTNQMLKDALVRKDVFRFTLAEWGAFCITDLRTDHFIQSGTSYFQPSNQVNPRFARLKHFDDPKRTRGPIAAGRPVMLVRQDQDGNGTIRAAPLLRFSCGVPCSLMCRWFRRKGAQPQSAFEMSSTSEAIPYAYANPLTLRNLDDVYPIVAGFGEWSPPPSASAGSSRRKMSGKSVSSMRKTSGSRGSTSSMGDGRKYSLDI
eukprot:5512535-Prymnesium_polylepis.1